MTSQFLLNGHKMPNFLSAFFSRFPRISKLVSLEWKQISINGKKHSSWLLLSFILANKRIIKNFDAQAPSKRSEAC